MLLTEMTKHILLHDVIFPYTNNFVIYINVLINLINPHASYTYNTASQTRLFYILLGSVLKP